MGIETEIDSDGNKYWKNSQGKIHNEYGPAIVWTDGSFSYWINGEIHREDGIATCSVYKNIDIKNFYIK